MDAIGKGIWQGSIREHTKIYDGHEVTLGFYGYLREWSSDHYLDQVIYEEKYSEWEWMDDGLVNVWLNQNV